MALYGDIEGDSEGDGEGDGEGKGRWMCRVVAVAVVVLCIGYEARSKWMQVFEIWVTGQAVTKYTVLKLAGGLVSCLRM